jgi:hypothetical protein
MSRGFVGMIVWLLLFAGTSASASVLAPGDFVMVTRSGGNQQLVVFDATTMAATVLASGGYLAGATDLAVTGRGTILLSVVDVGVVRLLPETGEQSVLATLDALGGGRPSGIALGPDGTVYVSLQGTSPRVVQLSAAGSFLRVVTSGGFLPMPAGMCFGADGAFYVCATALNGGGGLVRVDLISGAQTAIASNPPLYGPLDVAAAPDGSLWSIQFGHDSMRLGECVVRTRPADGVSETVHDFACWANGVAIRSDGVAVVGDCYPIMWECGGEGNLYTQVYPSGARIAGYGGPVAVVPPSTVGARSSSWGLLKTLYR